MESINNKNISNILDKYFEGLSTLEEEQQLRDYFKGEVGAEFAIYKPLFNCFSSERESIENFSEKDLANESNISIKDVVKEHGASEKRAPSKRLYYRFRWISIAAVAAMVVFMFTLLPEKRDSLQLLVDGVNTNNSELAISMAESQLSRVNSMLGKYNQSNQQLEGLNRVGDAMSPLASMGKLLKQKQTDGRLNSNNK